jgi:excisionase family DNA binding protein
MPAELLTPAQVAEMFKVNPKTVTRWARAGKISAIRTLGGHRRFRADEIRSLLDSLETSVEG